MFYGTNRHWENKKNLISFMSGDLIYYIKENTMRSFRKGIFVLVALGACISSNAFADKHMSMKEKMAECDTNKDGKISEDEFTKSKNEHFKKADKDGNKMLDADEQKMMIDEMHGSMKDHKSMENKE